MSHIIITRCKFGDDQKFLNYFEMMKKYYIPSINNQTNKNFKIALIANERHYELIRKEIDNKIEILRFEDQKEDYKDYVTKIPFTIQTRHDCDDYMSNTYVNKIQKLYESNKDKYETFILNFQPTKFIDSTQKEYTHSRDYSKACSMFSTLIQKNTKYGIFDVMHDQLSRISKNIIYIKDPYVKLIIHGNNALSKLNENDRPIK
jgi:hypothetical protein